MNDEMSLLIAKKAYDAYLAAAGGVGQHGVLLLKWDQLSEQLQWAWVEATHAAVSNSPAPVVVKCELMTSAMIAYGGRPITHKVCCDDTIIGVSKAVEDFRAFLEDTLGTEPGTVRSAETPK